MKGRRREQAAGIQRERAKGAARDAAPGVFRAGCQRETQGPGDLTELAYTDLAFAECPSCPHRLAPEDGPPFCRWLRADAPHPFAALATWRPE